MTVKMDMFCCQLKVLNVLHVKTEKFVVLKSTHNGQKLPTAKLANYC